MSKNMNIKEINRNIKLIAKKTGFKVGKEIYRGTYYEKNNLRNIIYSGVYKNKPAILKFYNDPRITVEPISLSAYLRTNKSKILTAPTLYKKNIISAHKGWFIAEQIPENYKKYKGPLNKKEREEFLNLFLEYRRHFSIKPTRKLLLVEKLSAENFHIFRINRWLELAQKKEAERAVNNRRTFLDVEFLGIFEKAILEIRKEFKNRKMIWCHGHFKPQEIFTDKERSKFYLIDFAHTAMFPEGYELAFIVWSDYLMAVNQWRKSFGEWKKGVDDWVSDMEKIAKLLKLKNCKNLIRASLIERIVGAILADIVASDRPDAEIRNGINLMTKLLKSYL